MTIGGKNVERKLVLADSALLASKASTPARKCVLPPSIAAVCQGELGLQRDCLGIDAFEASMMSTHESSDMQLLHKRYCKSPVYMCPTKGKKNHMYNIVEVRNVT